MKDKKEGRAAVRIGAKLRRLRRARGMTQAQLAERLGISSSYLNLIEHDRRNITVPLLLRLSELFGLALADLAEDDEGQLLADLMEVFGDELFDEHDLTTTELRELVGASPAAGRAVLTLYDAYKNARTDARMLADRISQEAEDPSGFDSRFDSRVPTEEVSDFIQERGNHFPDIEEEAERLRQAAGLSGSDPFVALVDYLKTAYGVRVAVLPPAPGESALRRYDPVGRRLELSEALPQSSRNFQLAHQLGLLYASPVFDMLLKEGRVGGEARSLGRIALANHFAAALLMPYDAFLESAKAMRYDIELLQHHFGTSFEQVCHRLTTLNRPGNQGVPFHMLRVDIAGNISKRFSLSGLRLPRHGGACPRWNVYAAFMTPGLVHAQLSRMPDGMTYFCIARTVQKRVGGYGAPQTYLSIGLGCEVSHAAQLVYADGIDLDSQERAVPAGIQCRTCERMDCRQRAFAPVHHRLNIDENVRAHSPYVPAG